MDFLQPIQYLLDPWMLLASSAYYLPPTILRLAKAGKWSTLFSWNRFQSAWFATFWRWAGPQIGSNAKQIVLPLLQGRTRHGRVLEQGEEKASPPISGTVIEIGSGIGVWVPVFAELIKAAKADNGTDDSETTTHNRKASANASTTGVVTKIYGVEPNTSVHEDLHNRVVDAGLEDVYEILPMGIEDLDASGKAAKGSIDCIVCVLCLCGIPEPQKNIRALYEYLKPGGRLYVYEHVRCSGNRMIILYQRFLNLLWPSMLGGCELRRETGLYLREAGPWSNVDLAQPVAEPWCHVVPHVLGILTK